MNNLILPAKLEEVLVSRWAYFVDAKRLLACVMTCVRDAHLPRVADGDVPRRGAQVTISRFEWSQSGFLLWADFSLPVGDDATAVGTTEMILSPTGDTRVVATVGTIFVQAPG